MSYLYKLALQVGNTVVVFKFQLREFQLLEFQFLECKSCIACALQPLLMPQTQHHPTAPRLYSTTSNECSGTIEMSRARRYMRERIINHHVIIYVNIIHCSQNSQVPLGPLEYLLRNLLIS